MKYKLVVFDFDGTIADTSEGIFDSHRFALKAMERECVSDSELRSIIGGNLLETYIKTFSFKELDARKAVRIYRERYAEFGIHKVALYPGFVKMVRFLKKAGYQIGVATLKAEKFAKIMLVEMGIAKYFNYVCGMDENDKLDKAGLILKCVDLCGVSKEETVLVGDSKNDLIGAQKAGVSFIAVTYGFGFQPNEKYEFDVADNTEELARKIHDRT